MNPCGYPSQPDKQYEQDNSLDLISGRYLNESAIREHALECSKRFRAGKFTRVGEDFITEVKVDVESIIRDLRIKAPTLHPVPETLENMSFVTGALCDKLMPEMNNLIGRIIQNKVQRQPTVGKTLSRTR